MGDDALIEYCARVCDSMAQELVDMKPTARRGKYDRQTSRQIDYAIRAVRKAAERIRALKGVEYDVPIAPGNGDKLTKALEIAKELRPVIAKARRSTWRQTILRKIDELLG